MKRIIPIICMMIIFSACNPNLAKRDEHLQLFNPDIAVNEPAAEEKATIDKLRIAYDDTDSLNPYTVKSTTNKNIIPLLYDPLVKLDRTYKASPYIAKSINTDGLKCTIKLRDDIYFSDNTKMTARDVIYSLDLAKNPKSQFARELANAESYLVIDNYNIEITLKNKDIFFENLLTFPIVKYRDTKDDEGMEINHIGTGRYTVSNDGSLKELKANEKHFEGNPDIKTINLITLPSDNTPSYSLKVGVIDYMFSELNSPDLYNISSSNILINMNNLVYMGMNSNKKFFSNPSVRRAVELVIDRDDIAGRTYSNKATAAYTPFNPSFWAMDEFEGELKNKKNITIASEILDVSGYEERDGEQYRLDGTSRLTLRLIINSESEYKQQMAEQMKEYFKVVGINVAVEQYTYDVYKQKLLSNDFDLYIAEVKLYDNMNISDLMNSQNVLGSGTVYDENLNNAYTQFTQGTITSNEFLQVFDEVKPFIPILYRRGMVAFSRDFSADIVATEQDIFYNIVNW